MRRRRLWVQVYEDVKWQENVRRPLTLRRRTAFGGDGLKGTRELLDAALSIGRTRPQSTQQT